MFSFRPLLIGYDTFERHRLVASLMKDIQGKTLDVGGSPGLLTKFTTSPVFVTNLEKGDVVSSGLNLPFANETFDFVTSLDVLEHIPLEKRLRFVSELVRVAKFNVITCAPFGSKEHIDQEKEIMAILATEGISNQMLAEHVQNGIPELESFLSYLPSDLEVDAWFSGDFRINSLLFTIDHWKGTRYFKLVKIVIAVMFNLIGNLFIYPFFISKQPRRFTNRMTFLITKKRCGQA